MPKQQISFIVMNPDDNCATALRYIVKNEIIEVNKYVIMLNQDIPLGHKFALKDLKKGDLVKKYGQSIGFTTEDIKRGDWIHVHNLTSQYIMEVLKNE